MNKEDLIAFGLTDEQVTQVLKLHSSALDNNFIPKTRFNELNEKYKAMKEDLTKRDTQIEELKKSAKGNEDLQKQIEALQLENKNTKISNAVEKALMGARAKNVTAVKALLKDLDKAEFADDGSIKGLEEQIKTLKADKSTDFLFESEVAKKPSIKGATPADPRDAKPVVDESKMSYNDFVTYYESKTND